MTRTFVGLSFAAIAAALLLLLFAAARGLEPPGGATVADVVQLNLHVRERRGETGDKVADMFHGSGQCDEGPSAVLHSLNRNQWLYICFIGETGKVAIWVMTTQIEKFGNEITRIPPEQISRPINYVGNVISRDGYVLMQTFGQAPEWFMRLVSDVIIQ